MPSLRPAVRRRRAGALAIAAIALAMIALAALARPLHAQPGAVRGVVLAREAGVPLGLSLVAIPALGVERFTDREGRFTLADLPAGAHRLLARHLGFAPVAVEVAVRAGETAEVRVALPQIAVRIAAVRVRADPRCLRPGPPSAAEDAAFAALFEQLQQNADRMRLLADAYPFAYALERTLGVRRRDGSRAVQRVDTLAARSDARARYRPGRVAHDAMSPNGRVEWVVDIPTLLDFADTAFQRAHCFDFGGRVDADGAPLLRIDFRAASRLRGPDVEGAFYLDPATYQVRRSEFRLTAVPRQVRGVRGVAVATTFREIVPGVPVLDRVAGANLLQAGRGARAVTEATEEQRFLHAEFLRGSPLDPPGAPGAPGAPAGAPDRR